MRAHFPSEVAAKLVVYAVERLGWIPPEQEPTTSGLHLDFKRSIDELGLESYLVDITQTVRGSTGHEWLDIRRNSFSKGPGEDLLDLKRSIFFHRLSLLNLGFAKDSTTQRDREETTYKELWSARWTSECNQELSRCALYGSTVEEAAQRELLARIESARELSAIDELVSKAIRCDLPAAVESACKKSASLSIDGDFLELCDRAQNVVGAMRMREDIRITRMLHAGGDRAFSEFVAGLFQKAMQLAPAAARCSDCSAHGVKQAFVQLREVCEFAKDTVPGVDTAAWGGVLRQIAEDPLAHPMIAGIGAKLLLERGELALDTMKRAIAEHMFASTVVSENPYLDGLCVPPLPGLRTSAALWYWVSRGLDALSDEHFLRVLPGLRSSLTDFDARDVTEIESLVMRFGHSDVEPSQQLQAELTAALKALARRSPSESDIEDALGDLDLGI